MKKLQDPRLTVPGIFSIELGDLKAGTPLVHHQILYKTEAYWKSGLFFLLFSICSRAKPARSATKQLPPTLFARGRGGATMITRTGS